MTNTFINLRPVEIKALANLFLDWASEDNILITPMKIQKLLFFCHADFIVYHKTGLLKQGFEAWDYGPVNPGIYRSFKRFGDAPISSRAEAFDPVKAQNYIPTCSFSPKEHVAVRERFDFYKSFSAIALSDLSHSRAGPWRQARSLFANGLNADRVISDELILKHHRLFDS